MTKTDPILAAKEAVELLRGFAKGITFRTAWPTVEEVRAAGAIVLAELARLEGENERLRKPNRDAMANRTEEEWDAIEEAIVTVYAMKPGHVPTADDVAAIALVDQMLRDDTELATEAYERGRGEGLRERGGNELVVLTKRADDATADLVVEKSVNAMHLAALADARRQIAELADRWDAEQAEYPNHLQGRAGAAAVRCCAKELRALLSSTEAPAAREEGLPERVTEQCGSPPEAGVGATAALATQGPGQSEPLQRWQRMDRIGLIETARNWADRQMVTHDTRTDLTQAVRDAAFYRADALYEFAAYIEDGNFDAVRPALASQATSKGGSDA